MNKNQTLGQLRELLTALGTVLATWGITDGNAWAPVTGVILAIVSVTWGGLHHKDPSQPGTLQWSLVRKLANVVGMAALTYGFLSPEKVGGIEMLVATLGPILAASGSWVSNDPGEVDDGGTGGGGLNLLLLMLAFSFLLPGCGAEYPIKGDLITPWFKASRDADGTTTITPKFPEVIVIPAK